MFTSLTFEQHPDQADRGKQSSKAGGRHHRAMALTRSPPSVQRSRSNYWERSNNTMACRAIDQNISCQVTRIRTITTLIPPSQDRGSCL